MDKRASKELIKTRKAVKEKFQKLKSDIASTEFKLESTYKPLIQPLKQLITKYDQIQLVEPKQEIKEEYDQNIFPYISTPKKTSGTMQRGQTPQLPLEMPSFFGDSRYDSDLPNTNREIQFQDTSVIAETEPVQDSSEEKTPTETLEEIINQTRYAIQEFVDRPGYTEYLEDYAELPRTYIDANIRDTSNTFDHKYGIIHDFVQNKFMLGLTQEPVNFEGKNIVIKKITYPGTVGLYELLFKKEPQNYTKRDLDNYMDILNRTNAYRDEMGNVTTSSNRYQKFRAIILPYLNKKGITKRGAKALSEAGGSTVTRYRATKLFEKPQPPSRTTRQNKTGKGLLFKKNSQNTDYVYWDNANELVDRLRLLISSTAAGHNAHTNEIISIIEELREVKLIQ